jgi:hypothetical protein
LGHTLDDQPITLDQFHGKLILWVILDGLDRTQPALPTLANIAAQFAHNPRVALVAINADIQMGAIPRHPPILTGGWINGYLAPGDATLFQSLPASPNWPAIFIITLDGKLLATGLSADETAAKITHFFEQ